MLGKHSALQNIVLLPQGKEASGRNAMHDQDLKQGQSLTLILDHMS